MQFLPRLTTSLAFVLWKPTECFMTLKEAGSKSECISSCNIPSLFFLSWCEHKIAGFYLYPVASALLGMFHDSKSERISSCNIPSIFLLGWSRHEMIGFYLCPVASALWRMLQIQFRFRSTLGVSNSRPKRFYVFRLHVYLGFINKWSLW